MKTKTIVCVIALICLLAGFGALLMGFAEGAYPLTLIGIFIYVGFLSKEKFKKE